MATAVATVDAFNCFPTLRSDYLKVDDEVDQRSPFPPGQGLGTYRGRVVTDRLPLLESAVFAVW